MLAFVKELWLYMKERKKFWLLPIFLVLGHALVSYTPFLGLHDLRQGSDGVTRYDPCRAKNRLKRVNPSKSGPNAFGFSGKGTVIFEAREGERHCCQTCAKAGHLAHA